jgi:hypothetical protein
MPTPITASPCPTRIAGSRTIHRRRPRPGCAKGESAPAHGQSRRLRSPVRLSARRMGDFLPTASALRMCQVGRGDPRYGGLSFPARAPSGECRAMAEQPVWHREGKEIYYLSLDSRLMATPVAASASAIDVGVARPLFPVQPGGRGDFHDVTADGRFLVNSAPERSDSSPITASGELAGGTEKLNVSRSPKSAGGIADGGAYLAPTRSAIVSMCHPEYCRISNQPFSLAAAAARSAPRSCHEL